MRIILALIGVVMMGAFLAVMVVIIIIAGAALLAALAFLSLRMWKNAT